MAQHVEGSRPQAAAFLHSKQGVRTGIAVAVLIALAAGAYLLHQTPGRGAPASFSLLTGVVLGLLFERGRFCFFCIFNDLIEQRNSGPFYAVLAALAAGGAGYAIVFGAFMPNAGAGRLPPAAPSGRSVGRWSRRGSPSAWAWPFPARALAVISTVSARAIAGRRLRFSARCSASASVSTWNTLYLGVIAGAPTPWLPAWLGYSGALAVHLIVLAALALVLLRRIPEQAARPAQRITPAHVRDAVLKERLAPSHNRRTGRLDGDLRLPARRAAGRHRATGSISRTTLDHTGWLPERLNGLDIVGRLRHGSGADDYQQRLAGQRSDLGLLCRRPAFRPLFALAADGATAQPPCSAGC